MGVRGPRPHGDTGSVGPSVGRHGGVRRFREVLLVSAALVAVAGCGGSARGAGPSGGAPSAEPMADGETGARTVRPGAPGEGGARVLTAEEIQRAQHPPYTEADVRFMQGMLLHHEQALVMTGMVGDRTTNQDIRLLARRIELSQDDEMLLMRRWLEERGESVPALEAHGGELSGAAHAGHGTHAAHEAHSDHEGHAGQGEQMRSQGHGEGAGAADHGAAMHGMLTTEQLARLAGASGSDFDRLFLEYMIQHHEGAVLMVAELFASPGAGQEEEMFQLASHVEADQNIEIRRMRGMLNALR